jgi:RHS repeat-associated protein
LTRHQRSAFEPLARGQSPPWRVKGNGSDEVTLQVYPHARYIDEVVGLRVKDQGRLYAHQDANWNVTALTDLTGRVIEQYWYSPYGQLEAHVAAHPFDFDDDGDVDAQDIAAGTSGGTCWGDYDGAGGDCKRLDANGDRDIDVDDYTIVNGFLTARHSEAALQRIPAASHSRRGNLFAHQGLPLDAELASYQNRARQYAPAARRFMQRDPLGYTAGLQSYAYGQENPHKFVDPYGENPLLPELELIVSVADDIKYGVGLGIEIGTSLPIGTLYGPAFSHCFSHCLITRIVDEQTSKEIGKDTEERQENTCLILKFCLRDPWIFPRPCSSGVCKSAQQQSDYYDNQLGREVASSGDSCFAGCQSRMGGTEHPEGPGHPREFGPQACPPGPRGNPNATMPDGWGP